MKTWRFALAALPRVAIEVGVAAALAGAALVAGGVSWSMMPLAGASSLAHRSSSCSARSVTHATGLELQLNIVKAPNGKLPVASVCIDGKGPYPFAISTGAGSSVVTPALVRSLHLKKGARTSVRGVTCTATAATATVANWSVSGLQLAPQTLLVAPVPKEGVARTAKGIIGSDVLSRFGTVRIDYRTGQLGVLGSEGAAVKGNTYVVGQANTSPPSALGRGRIELSAPLRVFEGPGGTLVAASVNVAGHAEQFAVDSGSTNSGLVPAVAKSLKLKGGGSKAAFSGLGCRGKGKTYSSGTWSLGGTKLRKASLVSQRIAGSVNSGLQGVLGSNVLGSYGSMIVDYRAAHLWLLKG